MLRMVLKHFDGDNNVHLKPGDIVDVAGWINADRLEKQSYIGLTDAVKATISCEKPVIEKPKSSVVQTAEVPAQKPPVKVRRSALASRPRVFRKGLKHGDLK